MVALATGPRVETPAPAQTGIVQRLNLPDLATHGHWIVRRLLNAYPRQTDRYLMGWLRNLTGDNHSWFMQQANAVCLFQVTSTYSLDLNPIVIERFVFAKEGYTAEAANFYSEVEKWTKSMGIDQIIVEQMSDVPHEMIKEKLGRLFTRQQVIARV